MAMDVAAFEHTQRNSQKREQSAQISIYTSDPVLLDTSAEFSMKRVHVHLMSHGNGTRCCCI